MTKPQKRTDLARARKRMRETSAREQLRQAREDMDRESQAAGHAMPRVPVYRGMDV